MRIVPASWLMMVAFLLAGCAGEVDWYLSINTYATDEAVLVGDQAGLYVVVSSSDDGVWLQTARWTVTTSPGPYSLVSGGDRAELYPYAAGTYVVRFEGWYRTSDGGEVYRSGSVTVWAAMASAQ